MSKVYDKFKLTIIEFFANIGWRITNNNVVIAPATLNPNVKLTLFQNNCEVDKQYI